MVSMVQVKGIIDKHEPNCSCGQVISSWDMKNYEHDGGIAVEWTNKFTGKSGTTKLWIYANCPKCDIDTKLAVLLSQIRNRQ